MNDINLKITTNKLACFLFLLIGLIYVTPIILADRYYVDDLNRAVLGYTWWGMNGRPLADVVMNVLNFSESISDISPLTQILGMASLMIIPYYIHCTHRINSVALTVMISLLVLTCPLFLETISYSFDSLTMMLSVSFMFLPFCIKQEKIKIRFISSLVCVVCSLSLYQASLSIFVALALIEFSRRESSLKSIYMLALDAMVFLLSNAIYKIFIADRFVKGAYSINKSKIINFKEVGSFDLLSKNIETFYNYTIMALGEFYISLLIALAVTFALYQIFMILKSISNFSYVSTTKHLIVLISPAVIASAVYLPLSILELPAFNARVLMSFGIIPVFLCASLLAFNTKILRDLFCIILTLMIIYSFSLCFAYGNGMQKQAEFESQVATMMLMDVNGSGVKDFHILGTAMMNPVTAQIIKNDPYFASLILPYITDKAPWRTGIFFKNHLLFDKYSPYNNGLAPCNGKGSIDRGVYFFETRDNVGVVCFK